MDLCGRITEIRSTEQGARRWPTDDLDAEVSRGLADDSVPGSWADGRLMEMLATDRRPR